jgi:hypothetical protein
MLTIRVEQMHTLEAAGLGRQASNILEFLRARYSEAIAGMSDDELCRKVTEGVRVARRFGLTWDSKVGAFVALLFDVSPRFYEHPVVRGILRDPRIPGNYRLDRLQYCTSEEDWLEIEEAGRRD